MPRHDLAILDAPGLDDRKDRSVVNQNDPPVTMPAGPDQRPSGRPVVGLWDATALCSRAFAGSIATRGRLIALGAFSLGIVLIAALTALNEDGSTARQALSFADVTLFGIALPLFVLFAAAGGLAEANTEGTLVYLWLRPIPRLSIALGAWLTTVAVAAPFTVVASAVVPVVYRAGLSAVLGALLGALFATMAYAALFSLLGLLSRFSTPIGLAYILVWESVIGRWGAIPRNLSIRNHAVSIATGVAGVRLSDRVPSATVATIVLVLATSALIGLTTLRLERMDVR